tara:strand:+ start:523 stop:675 length:153 start_codon:yes stop_codon:yes gene_type:complete
MIPQNIIEEIDLIGKNLMLNTKECKTQEEGDRMIAKASSRITELLKPYKK